MLRHAPYRAGCIAWRRIAPGRLSGGGHRRRTRTLLKPLPTSGHGGMTLVELLLVLVLLVVIGSMVVPAFTGSFSSVRLRRAGDQVLTSWSQARAEAIETGDAYQFRFTPETGDFVVERWTAEVARTADSTADSTTASRTSPSTVTSSSSEPNSANESDAVESAAPGEISGVSLPEAIVFYSGQSAVQAPITGERRIDSLEARGEDQSTPIIFFPDGSCTEASIVLKNDQDQFLRLTLRGLTGVGRASQVLGRDELQRTSRQ